MGNNLVGKNVNDIDTPALLVDMDALEYNIRLIAQIVKAGGALWRPHCKAIRSPEIAKKMIAEGACGVTCAKVSQAAALVEGGIDDILIANQVVGPQKIAALIDLACRATVCVACDDESNMKEISAAAEQKGVQVAVLVDVDIGMGRCGVTHTDHGRILALCRLAISLPGVSWRGLMGYDGHAQSETPQAQADTALTSERLLAVQKAVEAGGLKVPLISGAGSGNFAQAAELGVITEIQAGGGIFYCQVYQKFLSTAKLTAPVKNSLTLMAQVVSVARQASDSLAVGDAGWKTSLQWQGVFPRIISHPELEVHQLNAEHTIIKVPKGASQLSLGERIHLVPPYSDATLFLHRCVYGVRGDVVEEVFDLTASLGCLT